MQFRRLAVLLAAIAMPALGVGTAHAATPRWAALSVAAIQPGVMTETAGGQCTANFVFYDASHVYIGQAAHCAGTGGETDTNGCTAGSRPLGTPVTVEGATRSGTLAYSSWLTMRAFGERDRDVCEYNDFALIRLDPADASRVNPSVPFWGGPTGLNTTGTGLGQAVFSYGNSGLRLGLDLLKPKQGVSLGDGGSGWTHTVLTVTPGIPGDSGSAYLDASGRAMGVLSVLNILPLVGTNGVGDLSRELSYLRSHTFLTVSLATGTEPFRGPLL
jgi:hypothetical protein